MPFLNGAVTSLDISAALFDGGIYALIWPSSVLSLIATTRRFLKRTLVIKTTMHEIIQTSQPAKLKTSRAIRSQRTTASFMFASAYKTIEDGCAGAFGFSDPDCSHLLAAKRQTSWRERLHGCRVHRSEDGLADRPGISIPGYGRAVVATMISDA